MNWFTLERVNKWLYALMTGEFTFTFVIFIENMLYIK